MATEVKRCMAGCGYQMGYSGGCLHPKEIRLTPPLEIAANVLMTVSIVLAGRNNIHSWWIGIVGCVLFAVLFFQVNLYAD
ncbi:MAG: nicotinamide mononucleotide transporter, partial [Janthinobacterium sp.]